MALLNTIGNLVQYLPYLQTLHKGKDLTGQRQSAAQMANLTDALSNPNNLTYQNIYNQNRSNQQQDLASTIAEISRQNRKLVSMGRTPLLDQERGGETIFRNLITGNQQAESNARSGTIDQLRAAITGQAANYDAQKAESDARYANKVGRANSYYFGGDFLKNYNPQTGDFGDYTPPESLVPQTQYDLKAVLKQLFGL